MLKEEGHYGKNPSVGETGFSLIVLFLKTERDFQIEFIQLARNSP